MAENYFHLHKSFCWMPHNKAKTEHELKADIQYRSINQAWRSISNDNKRKEKFVLNLFSVGSIFCVLIVNKRRLNDAMTASDHRWIQFIGFVWFLRKLSWREPWIWGVSVSFHLHLLLSWTTFLCRWIENWCSLPKRINFPYCFTFYAQNLLRLLMFRETQLVTLRKCFNRGRKKKKRLQKLTRTLHGE